MGKQEANKYFEEQLQKKVLYIPNLSEYLVDLHRQILKLPHEAYDGKMSEPIGMTYNDIVQSFCNGVDLLYSILNPIRTTAGPAYPKCPVEESSSFKLALKKLDWCYGLMDDMDALNDRTVTVDMPDENYDPQEEVETDDVEKVKEDVKEDGKTIGDLPSNIQPSNDKKVGELEGKDEQHLAQTNLEKTVQGE